MFIIKTTATMKEYNNDNFWIDSDIIGEFTTDTSDLKTAIQDYRKFAEKHYITISDTAIKHKIPMYTGVNEDMQQIGFVFTASMDFDNDDGIYTKQYIELWAEILTIMPTAF